MELQRIGYSLSQIRKIWGCQNSRHEDWKLAQCILAQPVVTSNQGVYHRQSCATSSLVSPDSLWLVDQ
eukprot:3522242-Alexandrium_andersonii.AAC.1